MGYLWMLKTVKTIRAKYEPRRVFRLIFELVGQSREFLGSTLGMCQRLGIALHSYR